MCWDCFFNFFRSLFSKSVHQFANYSWEGGRKSPDTFFFLFFFFTLSLPCLCVNIRVGRKGGEKKKGGIWLMSGECYFRFLWALFFSGNKEQLLLKSYSKTCTYFYCCVALLIKHLFLLLLMSLHNCLQTNLTRKHPTYSLYMFSWGGKKNKYLFGSDTA